MEGKIRTALLNDSFPPQIDGVANAMINYANVLHGLGDEVMVATPAYPGVEDHYDFPVLRYSSVDTTKIIGYRAGYPFSASALTGILDFKPDIMHVHCPVSSLLLARVVREKHDVPVVFTYHTKFDIDIRAAVKGEMFQNSLIKALVHNIERADEVWVVSRGAGANLDSIGYEGKWRVMENGVDFERRHATAEKQAELSKKWNLPEDLPVFLFVGRMRWYKGIRIILEGLYKAKQKGASFRMLFVGDGSDIGEIKALTAELGLTEECIFCGSVQEREELRNYYSRADLFLFPSTFDTNGIVVREAAACGCGAVLVEGSCAAEDITDGRNGLFIRENADSMCEKVLFACSHLDEVRQVGLNAENEIYLSWEDAIGIARNRYAEILEEKKLQPVEPRHDMFPFLSDLVQATAKMRELHQQVTEKLK